MKDNVIRAFGIFLNDFPYFMLAVASAGDYLRVSKRRAFARMAGATLIHAVSILSLLQFHPDYRSIQIPHEVFFLTLYIVFFFFTVRISLPKLLFVALFVKLFADVTTSLAAFMEMNLWPEADHASFGLAFNIAHLLLLIVLFPPMYLFAVKQLRSLLKVESKLWRFLWLLPLVLFATSMAYSLLNKSLINTPQYIVLCVLLLAFSLLVYTLIAETFKTTRERTLLEANLLSVERMLEIQGVQYERLTAGIEATRQIRHDFRHQLAALNGYLANHDVDGAIQYCNGIVNCIPTNYDDPLCENFAVNAVAQHYAANAKAEGISVSILLDIPGDTGCIREGELCIVVGNLMENAIEACRKQEDGERFITLRALARHDYLTITMDNSFDGECHKQGDEFLSRKHEGVGIGLASIRRVAGKNGGEARFEQSGKVFSSTVVLRMNAA